MLKSSKKLFAILLIATFVAGMVVVPNTAFAAKRDPLRDLSIDVNKLVSDIEDEDVKNAVLRLNAFGVIAGMEDGKYHPDEKLTREQFAKILVTALKMDTAAQAGVGYKSFPDVAADRWSAGFIGVAAGQGLIQGYPDGTFKPAKEVTYAEAVTMLVRALGYKDEFLPGTWPGNYLAKGAEKDITKKVKFSDASGIVNRGDAALMVNNTFDAKLVKVDQYEGTVVKYYESKKTLLEDKFDIIKAEDARIVATKRVDDGLKWDQVKIYFTKEIKDAEKDKVEFEKGETKDFYLIKGYNPELVIGEEVTAYINDDDEVVYAESENDDKVNFDYVEEVTDKDELTLVKFDDDYPFADDAYVYMKDGDKVKQVNVDKFDDYDFVGKVGKFVVSNNEIVWAELMESTEADPWFVVMENNKGLLTGICADNAEHDVDLREDEDYDGVIVLDIDGQEISVDDIEEGNLIYVQKQEIDGDDYAVVRVVKNNIVEGKLDKVETKKIHLDGKAIKVVNNQNGIEAYYSVDGGDEIKQYNFSNSDVRDDMEDADGEDIIAYTDAVGRIAYFVTKASATSGYKYGVVTKVYADGDRIKVYVVDEDGEGDEIVYTMEEDKNLEKDGAFALNEFGQKTDKRATVKEGSPIKFKLNKDGEIAEDKIYVHSFENLWAINAKDDFGKDYLPIAKLYNANDYTFDSKAEAGLKVKDDATYKEKATFAADDKTKIIDAETYVIKDGWKPNYDSSEFDPANWKDLKEANGIDGFFYVFADDDNKYEAKAVVFIGSGSGAASDDEIGIYAIKEWYKAGDRYVEYDEFDGEKVEKELNDADDLYAGKEYPYVAKVKSNGKLEIVKPQNAKDFTVYFGEVKDKDSSRMTMSKVYEVTEVGNKKNDGENAIKKYKEADQEIFNISNKTLVYEEDNKKTTSSLKKGDLVIFIAEKGSNVRVIEKLKSGESDYKDIEGKIGKPSDGDDVTGVVTYISATGFTVDNKTAYFTTDRTILRDKNGNILLTGKDLTSKLRVGDQVDVTATGTDVDEVKIVKTKAELELEAAVKAANKALEDHIAAGGKAANTEYIALQNALEADPKVKADIEAATNSLKALTDAINAAKAAQAAYLAAGGSATDAVYKAVSTALAADPQVKTDIETATTALQSATTGMSKQAIVNAELAKIPATLVLAGDTSFADDTTGKANIKAAVEGLVDNNKVIVSTPTFTNPTWKVELTLRADGTIKADKEITVTNEKTVAEKAKVNAELAKVVDFTLPAGSACDINAIEAAVTAKVDLNKVEVTSVTAGTGTNKFDVTLTAKGGAYSDTKTITVSSADVNAAKALVPTTIASITVAGGNSATDAAKETAVKTYIEGLEGMTATGVTVTVTVTSGTTYEVVLTKNSISAKVTVTVTEFVAP